LHQSFTLSDFDDLRAQFPLEERNAKPIDAEPAAQLPPDWDTRLDKPWLLNLWQGVDEPDASKANFRIACYLEESTRYADAEKLAVLAAHYLYGMGNPKKLSVAECQRKARLAL